MDLAAGCLKRSTGPSPEMPRHLEKMAILKRIVRDPIFVIKDQAPGFIPLKTRVEGHCSPLGSSYTAFQLEEQADYNERDNEGSVI